MTISSLSFHTPVRMPMAASAHSMLAGVAAPGLGDYDFIGDMLEAGIGAGIGGVAGGVGGAAVGAYVGARSGAVGGAVGALVGGAGGALIGAVVGGTIAYHKSQASH